MRFAAALLWVSFVATSATAQVPDEFITSYWYGPPPKFTTFERYRQIKDANFNVVFPPGPPDASITRELNFQILEFCRQLGLKAVIFDPRMPRAIAGSDEARANIDAIVADYGKHPALLAYFIVDEPTATDFPALGEVVAYLKQRDPKHPGYINLFPTYAAPWSQLGTETYEEYLSQFIKNVDPFVISYDHYPFIKGYDRPDFFLNLAHIRNAAATSKRPFWNIAQLVQHYDYRALTEPELRFQAMQTLAFGGRGLLWYTYWYPGEPNDSVRHAMIDYHGKPDEPYEWIKSINADARAIGNELLKCESWAAFHTGSEAQYPAPQATPICADARAKLTIGVFNASEGSTLALVANRDYTKRNRAQIEIGFHPPVDRFNPKTKKWSPMTRRQGKMTVELPAGGGVLIRWRNLPS